MDLQAILRETEQLSGNVLVARFINGFEVAYEKQHETEFRVFEDEERNVKEREVIGSRTTVKYALLPVGCTGILSGHNSHDIETNKSRSFSPQAHSSIDAYIFERKSDLEDFRETAKQLFEEFTAPLKINEFEYRDWKDYGKVSLLVLGWPILLPYYLISGRKHDRSGDGGLAILFTPLLLPRLVKELFVPNEFLRRAYKVKDREGVLHKENRGNDPVIIFHHDDNPRKFTKVDIIFPNGMALTNHGLFNYSNQKYVIEKYNEAKFFLRPDEGLSKRVYDLNEREKRLNSSRTEFYRQLRESDHEGLLKSVGFLT